MRTAYALNADTANNIPYTDNENDVRPVNADRTFYFTGISEQREYTETSSGSSNAVQTILSAVKDTE